MPPGSIWSTGVVGAAPGKVVVVVIGVAPSMGSQFPKPPTDVMKLSTLSTVPELRAAPHRSAEATQMIRNRAA